MVANFYWRRSAVKTELPEIAAFRWAKSIYCTCHEGTNSARTAAGLTPSLVRPSAWNTFPDPVRNPNATEAAFRRLLKRLCSHGTSALSALGTLGPLMMRFTLSHWQCVNRNETVRLSLPPVHDVLVPISQTFDLWPLTCFFLLH